MGKIDLRKHTLIVAVGERGKTSSHVKVIIGPNHEALLKREVWVLFVQTGNTVAGWRSDSQKGRDDASERAAVQKSIFSYMHVMYTHTQSVA